MTELNCIENLAPGATSQTMENEDTMTAIRIPADPADGLTSGLDDFTRQGWIRLDGRSTLITESESLLRRAQAIVPPEAPSPIADNYGEIVTVTTGSDLNRS